MRIIAGTNKGRTLEGARRGTACGPTSDKLRETLFNILAPRVDGRARARRALPAPARSRSRRSAAAPRRRRASSSDRARRGADRGEPRALRRARIAVLSSATPSSARCAAGRRRTVRHRRARSAVRLRRRSTRAVARRRGAARAGRRCWCSSTRRASTPPAPARPDASTRTVKSGDSALTLLRMSRQPHRATHRHLSRVVRSADQRPRRHHRARRAALRPIIVAVLVNVEKTPLFSDERARRDHPRGVQGPAERRGRDLRRPAGRLRAAQERQRHRARPARGVGLRVRVPDGADEPPPRARHSRRCS